MPCDMSIVPCIFELYQLLSMMKSGWLYISCVLSNMLGIIALDLIEATTAY